MHRKDRQADVNRNAFIKSRIILFQIEAVLRFLVTDQREEQLATKTIALENGIEVTTSAPSKNFDPHHRARYAQVYGKLKHKCTSVEPTFRTNADRTHGRQSRGSQPTGPAEVSAPSGQSFQWMQGCKASGCC